MFTGGLSKMSRAEAKAFVEKEGGKILGTVSRKLDYLVVGNSKPTSNKIERGKQGPKLWHKNPLILKT